MKALMLLIGLLVTTLTATSQPTTDIKPTEKKVLSLRVIKAMIKDIEKGKVCAEEIAAYKVLVDTLRARVSNNEITIAAYKADQQISDTLSRVQDEKLLELLRENIDIYSLLQTAKNDLVIAEKGKAFWRWTTIGVTAVLGLIVWLSN